jgi:hypothetical protein
MRFLCPKCSEPIQVSDDLAGKATICPICRAEIVVPALFEASSPPGSPHFSTPTSASAANTPVEPGSIAHEGCQNAAGQATGTICSWSLTLCPDVLRWVVTICLGLVVLLTLFFDWNGAFPGGHAVYTQGAFKALAGGLSIDPDGENVIRANPVNPPEGVTPLRNQIRSNWLLLLVIPLIFVSFALSLFASALPWLKLRLPASVKSILPWQWLIVAGLSALTFVLLAFQAYRGFGLENAIRANARQEVERTNKLPDYPSASDFKRREIQEGTLIGRFAVQQTTALRLVLVFLLLAVAASGTMHWLTRRSDRPAPRIEIRC